MSAPPSNDKSPAFPFYPLCFAVFPILSVYSSNFDLVLPHQLVRPVLWATGAAISAALILWALARNLHKAALATTGMCVVFTVLGFTSKTTVNWSPVEHRTFFLVPLSLLVSLLATVPFRSARGRLWAFVVALLAAPTVLVVILRGLVFSQSAYQYAWITWVLVPMLAAFLVRISLDTHTKFLNAIGIFLVVVPGASILFHELRPLESKQTSISGKAPGLPVHSALPDIYYIILDGYGRHDALKTHYGYDNGPFLAELRERGFYIAEKSKANYIFTFQSLASSLNLSYFETNLVQANLKDFGSFNQDVKHNKVSAILRDVGYTRVSLMSVPEFLGPPRAEYELSDNGGGSLFEQILLSKIPLGLAFGEIQTGRVIQKRVRFVLDEIPTAKRNTTPHYIFAHVLSPHPPFVFDESGNLPPFRTTVEDGLKTFPDGGTVEQYKKAYVAQTRFIEKQILAIVDKILKRESKVRPVIVLQGDHGPRIHLNFAGKEGSDFSESFPILNAMLVPGKIQGRLYDSQSPVNTFRILFSELFGMNYPLLEDKCLYTSHSEPFQYQFIPNDEIEVDFLSGKP